MAGSRGAAERRRSRDQQVATAVSLPAPVKGWNARDPIANMGKQDAFQLDNWVARPGYCEIRRGFITQRVDFEEVPESLLVYRAAALEEMFAASEGSLYDVTSTGALDAPVVTGLSSSRIEHANFANDAGRFLIGVTGSDTPIKYDGSSWSTTAITGASGPITLDPITLIDVMAHKSKLWFIEKNSMRVWVLATSAIAGAADLLDLGPVFQRGGTLLGMGNWSPEGGNQNVQSVASFITDQGEVAVFVGSDPTDPTTFALEGVYQIAKPLGRRAIFKTASDLIVITYDGAVSLSVVRNAKREQQKDQSITSRIQNAFAQAAGAYGLNFGWEAMIYPAGQLSIINVPVTELGISRQFVQNTQTGAWSQFIGINAACWAYANGQAYFAGTDGSGNIGVFLWDTGGSDNGTAIQCDLITAFSSYGSPRQKNFTELRPILRASSMAHPYVDVLVDYNITPPANVPDGGSVTGGGIWGQSRWGVGTWSSAQNLTLNWTTGSGIGYAGAVRIRVVSNPASAGAGSALWDISSWDDDVWAIPDAYAPVPVSLIGFDLQYVAGNTL